MPRPPVAACGDETLYICVTCAKCFKHCRCEPPGTLVSIASQRAAVALRDAYARMRKEPSVADVAVDLVKKAFPDS